MTGRNLSQFIFSEDVSLLENLLRSALRNTAAYTHALLRFIRSDRTNVWISINARCVRDSTSADDHKLALCMRDATERTALEENLSLLAMTDSLTKLWNRRTFDHALRREWKLAFREGSSLSLLLVDLDHFKSLNDQYGHSVGDECLCDVASVLIEIVRTTDIVCRWGGDEIAVILPATDDVGACAVADKLCAAIEALRFRSRKESAQFGSITASIGVATVKCDQEEAMTGPHDLLRAADKALYQAKNDGRNRVRRQELVFAS
jgi:diguanylate cyclase (GGDEF)-like protein